MCQEQFFSSRNDFICDRLVVVVFALTSIAPILSQTVHAFLTYDERQPMPEKPYYYMKDLCHSVVMTMVVHL